MDRCYRVTERTNSSLILTMIILSCSGFAFAGSIGRTCSKALLLSSCSVAAGKRSGVSRWLYQSPMFPLEAKSGLLSDAVDATAEIVGILVASRVVCWSIASDALTDFGASISLFCGALVALLLYLLSLSLSAKDSPSNTARTCACVYRRPGGCLPMLGEAVTVSTSDLASLMEEGRWSTTPILARRSRGRALSDTAVFAD